MEIVTHRISVRSRQSSEVLLMPVGDVQWAGERAEVALGMLQRHIKWGVQQGAYFLGMGDYTDTFSPSNRQELRSAKLYDTARSSIDQLARMHMEQLYNKALKPSVGRWLGLLEGHHFHQYESGETSDMELARKLKTPFLGTSAYVRLIFERKGGAGSVLIWCHHGVGGGTTVSAALNKLNTMALSLEADIYLMGHYHRKVAEPLDYMVPVFGNGGGPVLVHRTKVKAVTGGFLRGYQVGARKGRVPRGNYVEQKMLAPVALGGVLVKIRPRWTSEGGRDLWRPDISVEV